MKEAYGGRSDSEEHPTIRRRPKTAKHFSTAPDGLRRRPQTLVDVQVTAKNRKARISMPTYIALMKWTSQGLQSLKESPARLDAARKTFEAAGVKMKDFYMVTGRYDMVAICDAPDEGAVAKALLSITSSGNLTSETIRAFTEQEYRQIIRGLP